MRILKTTQTYYPYLRMGGPPAKVRAIARGLARRGHEVTVLTADLGQEQESEGSTSRPNAEINNEHAPGRRAPDDARGSRSHEAATGWRSHASGWRSQEDGVEAVYLRTLQNYRATTINPQILTFCARQVRDYDLVHIYGLYDLFGSTAAWFCRRHGVPYVLEPLGMFGPKVRSQNKKRLYRKLVGNALFAGARVVVANSDTERNELIAGGIAAEKIVLRRNGIELAEFQTLPAAGTFRGKHNLDDKTPLLLFLGRISFIKGLDQLVNAFAQVVRVHPDARLVIAGPDDADGCTEAIRKTVAEFELGNRVILSGPLYGDERLQAFVDADVFVLPSRYESFGNVAAESIACGTPVLVTDRCGIAPLIDGSAALVVPCEVDGLRAGMERLLENDGLRSRLRAGCSQVARKLSWDEPVEQTERLYRSLVSQTREESSQQYGTPTSRSSAGC
jgi:glycosyltransferase involved in cell wall biosynthesis